MAPRPLKFGDLAKPKPISLLLPGLGAATGRASDRFRASSGTRDPKVYAARRTMVLDLAGRMLWDALNGVLERRFTVRALHIPYRQGEAALRAFVQQHQGRLLAPLYSQWKKEYRRKDRAKTFARIDRFLSTHGGKEATTAALTAAAVAAFLADLTAENTTDRRPASAATRNRYRAAIGVFATWLVARGHLIRHPIAYKAVPKEHEADARMPAPFAPEEYRRYFDAVYAERPDFGVVLKLLLHTGADMDEVLTRTVRDVDFKRGVIHYKRTKTRTPTRLVPFDDALAAELRGHLAAWSLNPSDRVFGMFARAPIETVHAHARQAIGRPDLRIKDLRHLAAISWVQAGVPITVVRDYLGHATLSQTQSYARFAPTDTAMAEHAARAAAQLRGPEGVTPISEATHRRQAR